MYELPWSCYRVKKKCPVVDTMWNCRNIDLFYFLLEEIDLLTLRCFDEQVSNVYVYLWTVSFLSPSHRRTFPCWHGTPPIKHCAILFADQESYFEASTRQDAICYVFINSLTFLSMLRKYFLLYSQFLQVSTNRAVDPWKHSTKSVIFNVCTNSTNSAEKAYVVVLAASVWQIIELFYLLVK